MLHIIHNNEDFIQGSFNESSILVSIIRMEFSLYSFPGEDLVQQVCMFSMKVY